MARTRAVALPLLLLAAAAFCTMHETFVAPRGVARVQPASGAVQPAQGKVARQAVDGGTGAAVASWLIVGGAWNKAMGSTEAAPVNTDAKWMWAPQQDEKLVYFLSFFMFVCVYFFGPALFP